MRTQATACKNANSCRKLGASGSARREPTYHPERLFPALCPSSTSHALLSPFLPPRCSPRLECVSSRSRSKQAVCFVPIARPVGAPRNIWSSSLMTVSRKAPVEPPQAGVAIQTSTHKVRGKQAVESPTRDASSADADLGVRGHPPPAVPRP